MPFDPHRGGVLWTVWMLASFVCATSVAVPPIVLECDYNNNGNCDAADYVLWRNGGPLVNDSTTGVGADDYDRWRTGFGTSAGSGAIVPAVGDDLAGGGAAAGCPGDYNNDGVKDAADYVIWRSHLVTQMPLVNESATPGVVDLKDYDVWRESFGKEVGSGAIAEHGGVPEPNTLLLTLIAAAAYGLATRFSF